MLHYVDVMFNKCGLCRFNCGTGAAQIVSESHVVLGQWHTVTVFRDGMSGWLRVDNDTPISGRSKVKRTDVKTKMSNLIYKLLSAAFKYLSPC